MSNLTIRLDDLHQLAALLPEATPPRMVAEVAQWAVEMGLPEDEGDDWIRPGPSCAPPVGDFEVIEDIESLEDVALEPPAPTPAPVDIDPALLAKQQPALAPPPVGIADENSGPDASADPTPAQAPARPGVRPWSDDDDEILLTMYAEGRRLEEIAEALGRSARAVDMRRQRLRCSDPRAKPFSAPKSKPEHPFGHRWTDGDDKTALALSAAGKNASEIAKEIGRTPKAVQIRLQRLKAAGAPSAPHAPPPEAAVGRLVAALNQLDDNFEPADDDLLVRQRYLGVGFADISDELGCDDETAKARWRAILKCGVKHAGGIVTDNGWEELRAAVALRAAEAEG